MERTVGEVLPAVKSNREKIDGFVSSIKDKMNEMEAEANKINAEYGHLKAGRPGQAKIGA